jgi:hypothetical protein
LYFFWLFTAVVPYHSSGKWTNQDTKKAILLGSPSSRCLSACTYDPVTDRYIYTNSVDGFSINYIILLKKSTSLVLKESMRLFQAKQILIMQKRRKWSCSEKICYQMAQIFGSIWNIHYIDVKNLPFLKWLRFAVYKTRIIRPFAKKQSNLSFDFNQRISMDLMGKSR